MTGNQLWTAFEALRKSPAVAYLLWLLLGLAGAHRFYLGMKPSGSVMFCLVCIGGAQWFLSGTPDEALLRVATVLLPLAAWVLLDVFRIPGFARAYNDRLIRRLSGDLETNRRWRTRRGRRRYRRR